MRLIETIPDFLERMARKDASKGYECLGIRTTQEIADYFGITKRAARRALDSLCEDRLITGYEASCGQPLLWGPLILGGPDDDGDGEPLPANDNEPEVSIARAG